MTIRHLLPIVLAGIMATWSGVSLAPAQPAAKSTSDKPSSDKPSSARPVLDWPSFTLPSFTMPSFLAPHVARRPARPAAQKPSDPPSIAFFVATGPANACGPGCDGWIAAEGKIDFNAADRLRKVLAKLGPRKLPLYLHSAGGSVLGAIELGRLIRSHNLTVSVARTIPAGCTRDDAYDKACETLKRSGQDVVSELDPSGAICNSACVLVLAGGARRTVPPWVKLGVHAIGVDRSKTAIRGAMLAAVTRSANARIVAFLHDMGIPKALFDASNAVPHESARFLERDELARFGLDTRDFGETDWRFADKPYAAIDKGFFVHTGDAGLAYPEALLRLNCGAGNSIRLTFARERPASAPAARPLRLTMNGTRIDLPSATQAGKIEIRAASLRPDALVQADDRGAVEVSWFDASGTAPDGRARDAKPPDGKTPEGKPMDSKISDAKAPNTRTRDRVVLTMTGFSAAFTKLRKVCTETASVYNGCSPGDLSPRCMLGAMKTDAMKTDGLKANVGKTDAGRTDARKTRRPEPTASGGQMAWPAPQ